MDREHEHDPEAQAAWALAAASDEADRILTTLNGCPDCATEATVLRGVVDWLGLSRPVSPPPSLRESVLAAARASRRRRPTPGSAQALAYATQVEAMDTLLVGLTPLDWHATVPKHRNVHGLIVHLAANDEMVMADLGLPGGAAARPPRGVGRHVRQVWREGASTVLEEVRESPADQLDQPVRLAGRYGAVRPLRDGLIQRAFETWVHADDVRTVMDIPPRPPPPEHVRLIVDLGARLLPAVLGPTLAKRTVRLVLSGPGGGTWDLPPEALPGGGRADATITADVVEFCRLLANRRSPDDFGCTVDGDAAVARAVLRAVASLGCD
jgi:uncharacterized protein (TIGR03083 family)